MIDTVHLYLIQGAVLYLSRRLTGRILLPVWESCCSGRQIRKPQAVITC